MQARPRRIRLRRTESFNQVTINTSPVTGQEPRVRDRHCLIAELADQPVSRLLHPSHSVPHDHRAATLDQVLTQVDDQYIKFIGQSLQSHVDTTDRQLYRLWCHTTG